MGCLLYWQPLYRPYNIAAADGRRRRAEEKLTDGAVSPAAAAALLPRLQPAGQIRMRPPLVFGVNGGGNRAPFETAS